MHLLQSLFSDIDIIFRFVIKQNVLHTAYVYFTALSFSAFSFLIIFLYRFSVFIFIVSDGLLIFARNDVCTQFKHSVIDISLTFYCSAFMHHDQTVKCDWQNRMVLTLSSNSVVVVVVVQTNYSCSSNIPTRKLEISFLDGHSFEKHNALSEEVLKRCLFPALWLYSWTPLEQPCKLIDQVVLGEAHTNEHMKDVLFKLCRSKARVEKSLESKV